MARLSAPELGDLVSASEMTAEATVGSHESVEGGIGFLRLQRQKVV